MPRFSAVGQIKQQHMPYATINISSGTEYCESTSGTFGVSLSPTKPTTMTISVNNRSYGKELFYKIVSGGGNVVNQTTQFTDGVISGSLGKVYNPGTNKNFKTHYASTNMPSPYNETFTVEVRVGSDTGTLLATSVQCTIYHCSFYFYAGKNDETGGYNAIGVGQSYGPSEKQYSAQIAGYIERQVRWFIEGPPTAYYNWYSWGSMYPAIYWRIVGNGTNPTSNADFNSYSSTMQSGFSQTSSSPTWTYGTSLNRDGSAESDETFQFEIRYNDPTTGTLILTGPTCTIQANTAASSN